MLRTKTHPLMLVFLLSMAMPAAHALETVFFQDFGCDGGGNDNCVPPGVATTPQTWTQVTNPDGQGGYTFESINPNFPVNPPPSIIETVRADGSTRTEYNPSNFSVTAQSPVSSKNWDIHDGDDNPWVSGYKQDADNIQDNNNENENMSGNMLGHEDENYNHQEANYYQVDNLVIDANLTDVQLMFDYDSWIDDDQDGFAVALSIDGGIFSLLNPNGDSDMTYRDLGSRSGIRLDELTGQTSGNLFGFDGHDTGGDMAGTAMFDLTGVSGSTISLRFAFSSNSTGSLEEGINIDNIKVTGICTSGSGTNCDPGTTGAPEPGSLALALLGLTAVYRHRRKAK